jgi:spore germination protein
MEIHVVQPGETLYSIAQRYSIPLARLIRDNGLEPDARLVIGQVLIITYPVLTYTVQEGDTLESVADRNSTTILQLLRNNPFLTDSQTLEPGETLVISYDNSKGIISTNGYAGTFINTDILRRTLPFLTYLSIFGYRILEDGRIIEPEDDLLINTAKEYKVAPVMLLSTLTEQGFGDIETAYKLISDQELRSRLITNAINILRRKGFYGLTMSYLYLNDQTLPFYESLTRDLAASLRREGFKLYVTISPLLKIEDNRITFERLDYSRIGSIADQLIILNYNWGYNYGPPAPVASVEDMRQFVEYIEDTVPGTKITIGVPLLGYIWELPYIIGISRGNTLTINSALALAGDVNAVIQYDEVSQSPYFTFSDYRLRVPIQYMVWFIDARTIEGFLNLILEFGLSGLALWNIMYYDPRIWLIINTQFQIETILP